MNTQPLTTRPAALAPRALARLGETHGYRLAGDTVHLHASFVAADPACDLGRAWCLRFIACAPTGDALAPADTSPGAAELLAGYVLAEGALPPLSELTGAVDPFEATTPLYPPSGTRFFRVALALLSRPLDQPASTPELHDFYVYPRPQRFFLPRFAGPIGCWFENDTRLVLDLDAVENPRNPENLSGTLSVEVWAFPAPYAGGPFTDAQPVAAATLGRLNGGETTRPGVVELRATRPPATHPHLVVMLREWIGEGFLTRDHVNFAPPPALALPAPFVPLALPAPVAVLAAEPVVTAAPTVVAPPPAAALLVATPTAPSPSAAPSASIASSPSATPSPSAAPAPTRVAEPAVAPATSAPLDLNTAPEATIAAVKGVGPRLAAAIVAHRPYNRPEELREVKGIGPKLFAKLRSLFRL